MIDLMTTMVPFLFVLAVVYGGLEVSEVFKKKQIKTILALAFALFAVTNPMISTFITSVLPYGIMLFILVFFLGFVMKFFGGKKEGDRDYTLMILVFGLFLLFLANYGLGSFGTMLPGISEEELMTWIGVGIIVLIFYAVYKRGLFNK